LGRRSALGFLLALCAMALLGAFVFGVSYYRWRIGWLGPIFLARAFTTVLLVVHVLAGGARRSRPELGGTGARGHEVAVAEALEDPRSDGGRRLRLVGIMVLLGLLDTGGYVCFNLGIGHAPTAIVAAASAPYALVPVAMGVSVLRERPSGAQWMGVGCVIAGVAVLGAVA
ncbi:MAG: EamA family transporter, partial [Solirubrobacteraceae bacterium]